MRARTHAYLPRGIRSMAVTGLGFNAEIQIIFETVHFYWDTLNHLILFVLDIIKQQISHFFHKHLAFACYVDKF